ncbi:MAG: NAD(P)/FAD-dependent oxidoreductase [Candidatus Eisenbacteria bacterium]
MATRRVIVVGGGAAGLMAAGQAARLGAEVFLLEKTSRPGRKLTIAGKGRCNLTNVAPLPEFISHFGPGGRFLRQAFSRFFTSELVVFLEELGVHTVTERGGRVFPAGGRAKDVVTALQRWVGEMGVTLQTGMPVGGLVVETSAAGPGGRAPLDLGGAGRVPQDGRRVVGVRVSGDYAGHGRVTGNRGSGKHDSTRRVFGGDAVIVATGGGSYPDTGSTGDGYRLAGSLGHTVVPVRPALVPLEIAGGIGARLQGLSLRNVSVRMSVDGKRRADGFGEMIFTHFGVSGPIILTLSKLAVDALRAGKKAVLSVDLKPALEEPKLDERLLRDIKAHGKQKARVWLKELLPRKLIPLCMDSTNIAPDRPAHQITAEERRRLRTWLKDFRLEVTGHRPLAEAIVTAGGVDTREVDPRTMASRLVRGLYFAGEVLDIDADTGGYNLQAAFSTGWVAGRSAARGAPPVDPRRPA